MNALKDLLLKKNIRKILVGIGVLFLAVLIFHAGISVGSHRHVSPRNDASWGFRAPGGFNIRMPRGFISNGHGAVGTIQSVASSSVSLKTRDGRTQTVLLTGATTIKNSAGYASSSPLSVGQQIVVLGTPDSDGNIAADLIRVMPRDFPSMPRTTINQ